MALYTHGLGLQLASYLASTSLKCSCAKIFTVFGLNGRFRGWLICTHQQQIAMRMHEEFLRQLCQLKRNKGWWSSKRVYCHILKVSELIEQGEARIAGQYVVHENQYPIGTIVCRTRKLDFGFSVSPDLQLISYF